MPASIKERAWLAAIFILYLGLAASYSLLMPQWEGMDEPAHYLLVLNLARVRKFSSLEANYEAAQPQTYYRLAAIPLRWLYLHDPQAVAYERPDPSYRNSTHPIPIFPWSDQNFRWVPGLMLLRWLNILLGLGVLGLNYAALRRMAGQDRAIALTGLALVALNPQFLHTAATVNNDGTGNLAGAFLFWLLSLLHTRGLNKAETGLTALLALLLPFATKLTLLPLSAAVILALGIRSFRLYQGSLLRTLLVFAAALTVLGLLLPEQTNLLFRNINLRLLSVLDEANSASYMWRMVKQLAWTFWGKAGWIAVGLPAWMVVLLTGLSFAGAGRNLLALIAKDPRMAGTRTAWRDLWLAAVLPFLAIARNALATIFSQGRFFFTAIGPINYLIISGWHLLISPTAKRYILPAVVALLLLANLLLWVGGLLPVYYQPFDIWFQ